MGYTIFLGCLNTYYVFSLLLLRFISFDMYSFLLLCTDQFFLEGHDTVHAQNGSIHNCIGTHSLSCICDCFVLLLSRCDDKRYTRTIRSNLRYHGACQSAIMGYTIFLGCPSVLFCMCVFYPVMYVLYVSVYDIPLVWSRGFFY